MRYPIQTRHILGCWSENNNNISENAAIVCVRTYVLYMCAQGYKHKQDNHQTTHFLNYILGTALRCDIVCVFSNIHQIYKKNMYAVYTKFSIVTIPAACESVKCAFSSVIDCTTKLHIMLLLCCVHSHTYIRINNMDCIR